MAALVTLESVKEYLQITGTTSDALIGVYIDIVESELDAVLDRNLAQNTYTEVVNYLQSTFDQTGYSQLDARQPSPKLFLDNVPVVTITSIVSADITVTSTAYSVDSENGVLSTTSQLDEPTVTYVAGYTTGTLPNALGGVIKMGVANLFNNNTAASSGSGNVKSKTIKDFSVSYGNEQNSLIVSGGGGLTKTYLSANAPILNRYKRVRI